MGGGLNLGVLEGFCPLIPRGMGDRALCFVADWEIPLFLLLVLVVAGAAWVVRRAREEEVDGTPLLVFPMGPGSGDDLRPSAPASPGPMAAVQAPVAPAVRPNRPAPGGAAPDAPVAPGPAEPASPNERTSFRTPPEGWRPGDPIEGDDEAVPTTGPPATPGGVGYMQPPDGTLQLLPGRLEVERGPNQGQEIRFVRVPGSPAEVTFGRSDGPAYRHVRLDAPTVSRLHARLTFADGNWTLSNESSTNPTRVNDRVLSSSVEAVPLADGDRIEIGDVAFRYRVDGATDRLPLRSSWYTDQGRRPTNQDAVVVRSLPGGRELAAVCDGMGSHQAGGLAAHRAIEALVASLTAGADLVAAVHQANTAVRAAADEADDREGMGTTLVALLRDGDRYEVANVGDSRAWRLGPKGLEQVSVDHSFVAEATAEGRMSREEAERSPWRNAVTRNLGAGPQVEVDRFGPFDANEPHLVILSTDGVHGVLEAHEIESLARETPDIRDLARALSERALVRGGEDNVAVAAIAFGTGKGTG
jgi:PPM family protein phosphatase